MPSTSNEGSTQKMGFVRLSLPTLSLEGTDQVKWWCFQVHKAKLVQWSSNLVKPHVLAPKPNLLGINTNGGGETPCDHCGTPSDR